MFTQVVVSVGHFQPHLCRPGATLHWSYKFCCLLCNLSKTPHSLCYKVVYFFDRFRPRLQPAASSDHHRHLFPSEKADGQRARNDRKPGYFVYPGSPQPVVVWFFWLERELPHLGIHCVELLCSRCFDETSQQKRPPQTQDRTTRL